MDPLTIGMLAATLYKAKTDADQSGRDRQADAAIQRYSPWTHMQAPTPTNPNTGGTLLGGIGAAAASQQSADRVAQKDPLLDTSVASGGAMAGPSASPADVTGYPQNQMSYQQAEQNRLAKLYGPSNMGWMNAG